MTGLWLAACQSATAPAAIQQLTGETMGTYYRVSYPGDPLPRLKDQLDSLLVALNAEVSTYIPTSTISLFNQAPAGVWAGSLADYPHFRVNLELAARVYQQTGGYFDPTVMPLVNYWGFGYTPKQPVTAVDSVRIDSIMQFVGLAKLNYQAGQPTLTKPLGGVQLDFSACAKGYGVDLVGRFLADQGIKAYLVDIGGEVLAQGEKNPGKPWRVGINVPQEEASPTDIQAAVPLTDAALATSGNYRNFYQVGDQKYSHTINPFTGFPERSQLLSASILATDCATADAYDTACMVMGLERGLALVESLPDLEAYFIYSDANGLLLTSATPGFQRLLDQQNTPE